MKRKLMLTAYEQELFRLGAIIGATLERRDPGKYTDANKLAAAAGVWMSRIAKTDVRTFTRLFKPQFAGLVESGLKLQTVRPLPKRMPKAGVEGNFLEANFNL